MGPLPFLSLTGVARGEPGDGEGKPSTAGMRVGMTRAPRVAGVARVGADAGGGTEAPKTTRWGVLGMGLEVGTMYSSSSLLLESASSAAVVMFMATVTWAVICATSAANSGDSNQQWGNVVSTRTQNRTLCHSPMLTIMPFFEDFVICLCARWLQWWCWSLRWGDVYTKVDGANRDLKAGTL
jgi:hypothetical protein